MVISAISYSIKLEEVKRNNDYFHHPNHHYLNGKRVQSLKITMIIDPSSASLYIDSESCAEDPKDRFMLRGSSVLLFVCLIVARKNKVELVILPEEAKVE